jgi:hypothetical protein
MPRDPDVLAAALRGISCADLVGKEKWALQKFAVSSFMAGPGLPAQAGGGSSAIVDLDQLYSLMSKAAGVRISRPTAATALLRTFGIDGFEKRISKLTSRRHLAAHPDACLLHDLRAAFDILDPAVLAARAAMFRDHAINRGEASPKVVPEVKVNSSSDDEDQTVALILPSGCCAADDDCVLPGLLPGSAEQAGSDSESVQSETADGEGYQASEGLSFGDFGRLAGMSDAMRGEWCSAECSRILVTEGAVFFGASPLEETSLLSVVGGRWSMNGWSAIDTTDDELRWRHSLHGDVTWTRLATSGGC